MKAVALLLDSIDEKALRVHIENLSAAVVEAWNYNDVGELLRALKGYDLVIAVRRKSYLICGFWTGDIVEFLRKNGFRVMLVHRKINV